MVVFMTVLTAKSSSAGSCYGMDAMVMAVNKRIRRLDVMGGGRSVLFNSAYNS
jgi:hypothetical protein